MIKDVSIVPLLGCQPVLFNKSIILVNFPRAFIIQREICEDYGSVLGCEEWDKLAPGRSAHVDEPPPNSSSLLIVEVKRGDSKRKSDNSSA